MSMIELKEYAAGAHINPNFKNYQSAESASLPFGYSVGDARELVLINPKNVVSIEIVQVSAGGGFPAGKYYRVNMVRHSTAPGSDRPDWFVVNKKDADYIASAISV